MENQPIRSWFRLTSLARGDIQPQALTQPQTTPAPTAAPRTRLPVPTTQPAAPQPQPQPPRTPTPPQPQPLRAPTPPPPQPQPQPPRTPTPPQPQPLRAPTPPPPQPQLQAPRTPTPPPVQTQNAPRTPTPPPLQTQTAPRTPTPPPLQTQTALRTPTPPPPPPQMQNGPRAPTPPIPQQSLRERLRSLTQQETTLGVTSNAAKDQPPSAGRETMSTIAPIPRVAAPTPRVASRSPTPPQSPKVITTSFPTPQSPRTSRTLPPTTLIVNPEPEPKTVQMPATELKSITTSNGSRISRSNASLSPTTETTMMGHPPPKEERRALDTKSPPPNSKEDKSTVTQTSKKFDKEMSIINLAGENMGAHMEVGYRKLGQKQASGPRTLNEKATEEKDTKAAAENAKSMASLVNSNVQCINNSLLLNSSCTQQSPGVHITLSRRKPKSSNSTAHSPWVYKHPCSSSLPHYLSISIVSARDIFDEFMCRHCLFFIYNNV